MRFCVGGVRVESYKLVAGTGYLSILSGIVFFIYIFKLNFYNNSYCNTENARLLAALLTCLKGALKGLSHEIDFKKFDKNLQNLA